jgi:hypothetical protein
LRRQLCAIRRDRSGRRGRRHSPERTRTQDRRDSSHLVGRVRRHRYVGAAARPHAGASALFASGEDGKIITAADHRGPWVTLPSGTTGNLLAGLYYNDSLFIVGENEIALQSGALFSSRMINISTRGQVGTGSNLMISGFVVTGERPKQVLVRAAGPTLAASFGLSGTLAAPVLTLVDNQNRVVAANTGWTTGASPAVITETAARVGAFPFAANSADSALIAVLQPGAYTALISGANNSTGLSIVEVYDADVLSNENSRAINISTRGIAGAGANRMIAGFVIEGASSRRVLIRAVGPALAAAPFNVGGTLAEPQIELYNSRNLLHATAGAWGLQNNADEIRGAAKVAGAFDLPDGGKDSAMVVTLLPEHGPSRSEASAIPPASSSWRSTRCREAEAWGRWARREGRHARRRARRFRKLRIADWGLRITKHCRPTPSARSRFSNPQSQSEIRNLFRSVFRPTHTQGLPIVLRTEFQDERRRRFRPLLGLG